MNQNSLFEDFSIIGKNTVTFIERFSNILNINSSVLITGETGTGKELAARWIHFNDSRRKNKPFVKITIPNIGENIFESEVFGYEKGAFTGAVTSKNGLIDIAEDGTIFFDEIETASPLIQSKLLQLFEDRLYRKVGDTRYKKTDARFIISTNINLKEQTQKNLFREDLYYRLAIIEISLPPLRERGRDLLEISNYYIKKYSSEVGKKIDLLSEKDLKQLQRHTWPGNIRELKNFIERAVIFSSDSRIDLPGLMTEITSANAGTAFSTGELTKQQTTRQSNYSYKEYMRQKEQEFFQKALSECKGNIGQTAKLIDMSIPFVYKRIKELGIQKL